jgi:uncharacterized protein DUF3500
MNRSHFRKTIISPFSLVFFFSISLMCFYSFKNTNIDLAIEFLNSLDEAQKEKAQYKFNDLLREEWHFFPVAMYRRPGILLKDLDEQQKNLFFDLLKSYLSESGYNKTQQIISLENVLSEMENNTTFRNPELYLVAFYGNPGDPTWCWTFEGHHISLNFTIVKDKVVMVPLFLGANPAEVRVGDRKGERVLAKEEDIAFELLNQFSAEQKAKAIFQEHSFWDLASGTSPEVGALHPVGIKFGEMNKAQSALLFKLINEYLSTMPDHLAKERMTKIMAEDLGDIRFGWAGAAIIDKPHYYRIQGKTFLIEFDNSQNEANHIHTVWRDFAGDFGRDLLRAHYAHDHK